MSLPPYPTNPPSYDSHYQQPSPSMGPPPPSYEESMHHKTSYGQPTYFTTPITGYPTTSTSVQEYEVRQPLTNNQSPQPMMQSSYQSSGSQPQTNSLFAPSGSFQSTPMYSNQPLYNSTTSFQSIPQNQSFTMNQINTRATQPTMEQSQYVYEVLDVSSEYSSNYSARNVIGKPRVYPLHGK